MALTVYKQPQELTPGYNSQWFTAYSDQNAVTGFKYSVTITVNGDTAKAFSEKYLPRPDGWLVFDAMEWVKNYIEHYFNPDINLASPLEIATNKTVSVSVVISEYGVSPFDTETVNYQAFDACLTEADFATYDFSDYTFNGTTGKYFLSKSINSILPDSRITLDQDLWLHFIQNGAVPIVSVELSLVRSASTIQTITIAALPTPVYTYDTLVMQVAPKVFTSPLVDDIVHVKFLSSSSPVTVVLDWTYTIQSVCTKFTDYVIYYLDRDGNILSFHFEFKSTVNYTKKENTVTLDKNVLNTSTGSYGSNSWDRDSHIISSAIESTLGLNTGWITEAQSQKLRQLWSSPLRWIWDGDTLRACKVTNNGYEQKIKANERMFNYDVTVDLGVTETVQRGL